MKYFLNLDLIAHRVYNILLSCKRKGNFSDAYIFVENIFDKEHEKEYMKSFVRDIESGRIELLPLAYTDILDILDYEISKEEENFSAIDELVIDLKDRSRPFETTVEHWFHIQSYLSFVVDKVLAENPESTTYNEIETPYGILAYGMLEYMNPAFSEFNSNDNRLSGLILTPHNTTFFFKRENVLVFPYMERYISLYGSVDGDRLSKTSWQEI